MKCTEKEYMNVNKKKNYYGRPLLNAQQLVLGGECFPTRAI